MIKFEEVICVKDRLEDGSLLFDSRIRSFYVVPENGMLKKKYTRPIGPSSARKRGRML